MSSVNFEQLSAIIEQIYDTVLEPSGWTATMASITEAVDAAYSGIALSNTAGEAPSFAAQSPWDPEQMQRMATDYGFDDIPGLDAAVAGDIDAPVTTFSVMSEAEFRKSRFYRNWAGPQGLREGCSTKFVHTPDRFGLLLFTTRDTRGVVTADEQRILQLLSPHIRRAVLIGDLLDHARISAHAYHEVIYRISVPIVLTTSDGTIVYANASAETMLSTNGPILSAKGVLQGANPGTTGALLDAIARASDSAGVLGSRGIGLPISAARHAPAIAYVLPLKGGTERAQLRPATAAVFISTAVAVSQLPEAVLSTLFDLTPAEARVMAMVGAGRSSGAAVQSLGITENTLKTHLNRIYMKTGTSRQAELVKLLADIGVPVHGPSEDDSPIF